MMSKELPYCSEHLASNAERSSTFLQHKTARSLNTAASCY